MGLDPATIQPKDSPPLAQPLPPGAGPGGRRRSAAGSAPADPARCPTAARRSHAERILAWAIAGHVVHQDDWYNRGADGGSAIKAVRSRISELEAEGYGFHHTRRPDATVEYTLAYVPEPRAPRPPEEPCEPTGDDATQLALELGEIEPQASRSPFAHPGFPWDDE